jgi:hypothetical protein
MVPTLPGSDVDLTRLLAGAVLVGFGELSRVRASATSTL